LTAYYARGEDIRRAEESGFHTHVAKPASPETLIDAIRCVMKKL
jgi:CheY-like chemotaxis protein